jgi:hypothetical protein
MYNYRNSSRIHHLRVTSKSHISLFAPTLLWLLLSLGQTFVSILVGPYGCQGSLSVRGNLNPRVIIRTHEDSVLIRPI